MKNSLALLKAAAIATTLCASSAFAWKDGTYTCKNGREGLPNNTFKVSTVTVAPDIQLPYFDSTRYFKASKTAPVQSSQIRGIASHIKTGNLEILTVAAVSMEFEGDTLLNCEAP